MDNWQKIFELYDKQKSDNVARYIDATITSVREDYLRATVRFITGQVVEDMLNKSGEKLNVGQNVKVQYFTIPSKGWIYQTYGEADPLHSGGVAVNGSVTNAVVLQKGDYNDMEIINRYRPELLTSQSTEYGLREHTDFFDKLNFIVVQGLPCILSPAIEVALPSNGGAAQPQYFMTNDQKGYDLFNELLTYKDIFSSCSWGDLNSPRHSLSQTERPIYHNWGLFTYSVSRQSNGKFKQYCYLYRSQWLYTRWRSDPVRTPVTDYFYDNLSDEAKEQYVQSAANIQCARTTVGGAVYEDDGTNNLKSIADDGFLVPVVTQIMMTNYQIGNTTHYTPYSYVSMYLVPIVNNRWCYSSVSRLLKWNNIPFASQAELDYALGVTKRFKPT